ncbi:MAG TPA: hypothetical protein DIV79_15615 [Opitutae bacterium]|nr:hypothetical protein [Opitutaceae bacterium]HCR31432.1 hypothetical protein [Opitutae bacterium]
MGIWKTGCISILIGLSLLAGQASSQAEEVELILTNGDRLKGELVSEGETIVLKHAVLGELSMANGDVRMIERPKPQPVSPKPKVQKPTVAKASPSPEPAGKATGSSAKQPGKLDRAIQATRTNRFVDLIDLDAWTQQLEFGMNAQSGRRDKVDFNTLYSMRRKIQNNDFRLLVRRYYGESNQEKTTDRTFSNFRWRHDISPGVFYQSDTEYSSDRIKEIDLNLEQTLGVGYRFLNQKALKVSTGMGMSSRYRDRATVSGETSYLVDLFQDIDYRVNNRLRLTQEFKLEVPPDKEDEYEYEFRMGMTSKVNEALHLSLRYQLEYDRSLPEDRREDQRVVSSVGIDF